MFFLVSPPFSPLITSTFYTPPPFKPSLSQFRKGQVSHRSQQGMTQQYQAPTPAGKYFIKATSRLKLDTN